MTEKSIQTEKGTLYYVVKEDRITVTTYHGNDSVVELPAKINGLPVRKVGKKAFMNSRQLRRIVVPDTVKKLSEWAFAYCDLLEEVELPKRQITMGTGVFLGDKRLSKIVLRARKKEQDSDWARCSDKLKNDTAALLAVVPFMEDGEHLLNAKDAGNEDWINKWDARLVKILEEPDEKGYTDVILCGEEDINCNLENFVKDKRKKKVRFCFLRLLNDSGLQKDIRVILEDYLISHIVGCASMETWLVLKEEKGHIREYYELYAKLGCLNCDNYDATLADLGEKQPEMKAYFMRWHEDYRQKEGDFFDIFEL